MKKYWKCKKRQEPKISIKTTLKEGKEKQKKDKDRGLTKKQKHEKFKTKNKWKAHIIPKLIKTNVDNFLTCYLQYDKKISKKRWSVKKEGKTKEKERDRKEKITLW